MIGSAAPHFSLALEGDPQRRAARRLSSLSPSFLLERFFAPSYHAPQLRWFGFWCFSHHNPITTSRLLRLSFRLAPSPARLPTLSHFPTRTTSDASHLTCYNVVILLFPLPRTEPVGIFRSIRRRLSWNRGRRASCLVASCVRRLCGFHSWNYNRDKALDLTRLFPPFSSRRSRRRCPASQRSSPSAGPNCAVLSSFPRNSVRRPTNPRSSSRSISYHG